MVVEVAGICTMLNGYIEDDILKLKCVRNNLFR